MKLVTFNVNGIRARQHQLEALIKKHSPDVIGLQETKVENALFPQEAIENLGYHVAIHGQKGHYGVALLTRKPPLEVSFGLPKDTEESQKRLIAVTLDSENGPIHIYNGYFPQGESRDHPVKFPAKQRFYADLTEALQARHSKADQVVLMGDMNITPRDQDIGIGEENRLRWLRTGKASFLPEEREWLQTLYATGLVDAYEHIDQPHPPLFSWFDYRSGGFEREPKRGLRIDLILLSEQLKRRLLSAEIDYEIRAMDRPSDHCPVIVQLK